MGKKRRLFHKIAKYGRKHFEILDRMDGVDDDVISSAHLTGATALRTLGLVDNGDRTVSLHATMFGSGSAIHHGRVNIHMTGGTAVVSAFGSYETIAVSASSAAHKGYNYKTSLPAIQRVDDALPYVFPAGLTEIELIVYNNGNPDTLEASKIKRRETIQVGQAPIGLSSTLLSSSLSETGALTINCAAGMVGTAPQHGSGSGIGSSQVYAITASVGHGFNIAAVGSLTGSLTLTDHAGLASTPNGHGSASVQILASASVAALAAQDLTVTFTPVDIHGVAVPSEAVSTVVKVPFPVI